MKTARGFEIKHFTDCYGKDCSIQESSSASEDCVWLGIHKADILVMAQDLDTVRGLNTTPTEGSSQTVGWHIVNIPDTVQVFSRMHLNREQAKYLIKELQYFVKYGRLRKE